MGLMGFGTEGWVDGGYVLRRGESGLWGCWRGEGC